MTKLLEQMRNNPRGDWTIRDVETVCRQHGANCRPPRGGGSHYTVSHRAMPSILTIPFKRPIKAVYIRRLVDFIDAARKSV
jgi:hypothetical protein